MIRVSYGRPKWLGPALHGRSHADPARLVARPARSATVELFAVSFHGESITRLDSMNK
jgi:hypothetical protein